MLLQEIEICYSQEEKYERDNLYAGVLGVKVNNLAYNINDNTEGPESVLKCRKILFNLDDDNLAEDLIWNVPRYKVEGFIPQDVVTNEAFIVSEIVGLSSLLVNQGYPEMLVSGHIKEIYNRYLKNDKFYFKNSELFGYEKRIVDEFWEGVGPVRGKQYVYADGTSVIDGESWNLCHLSTMSGLASPLELPASKRLRIKP
ncbi:MAG: hypothetical protein U0M66_01215 [Bacilli bacterium]|nr:hypothetical protein [Bacilli bacterium]